MTRDKTRCARAGSPPIDIRCCDTQWKVPLHDDPRLFEFLALGGA